MLVVFVSCELFASRVVGMHLNSKMSPYITNIALLSLE